MKKLLFALVLLCSVSLAGAQSLTVATYNIRNANDDDRREGNGWEQRSPYLCQLVQAMDFDIFGAQEVLHGQLVDMLRMLPGYAYIGVGRDDGKTGGEYSPVFYKAAHFKLLKDGHFWLSETPDKPAKGWDAACVRICTWGHFEDKVSHRRFWFFNLHMDHIGVVARRESAKLVIEKIKAMCGEGEKVVLTGDFNVDQESETYRIFADSGILKDSYLAAEHRFTPNGTFNDFQTDMITFSRIDHIFVTPSCRVKQYSIMTDTYRSVDSELGEAIRSGNFPREVSHQQCQPRTPSDHFPVVVRLNMGGK